MEKEEFFLEEIIQYIQCFLSAKEGARTSILSKSWHKAWLTRPNLDFVERDFSLLRLDDSNSVRSPSERAFVKLANKTMQRYEESKRKIQSFRLRMHDCSPKDYALYKISLANELTRKAVKLGATDIDIELDWHLVFLLPDEVLHEPHTLVKLNIMYCKIDLKQQQQEVRFSRLKSLRLRRVRVESGNIIWDIVSMCPMIEELVLSECKSAYGINSPRYYYKMLALNDEFRKLKVLSFEDVEIGGWLFRDLSSRFPSLTELTLHNCNCSSSNGDSDDLQICSNSLEYISFAHRTEKMFRAKFDVPRIRKFIFSTSCVPSLSFKTISTKWEADISFRCKLHNFSWFQELRVLLMELITSSKIYLYLKIGVSEEEAMGMGMERDISIIDIPKPPIVVEKLTLLFYAPSLLHSTFVEDLFWTCVPTSMIMYRVSFLCQGHQANNDFVKLLCNTLIKQDQNSIPSLRDLEEVNVEFFEMPGFGGGKLLPCKTLLDALAYPRSTDIQIRLQLTWAHR